MEEEAEADADATAAAAALAADKAAAVEAERATLADYEALLTEPVEFGKDTPPIWVRFVSGEGCHMRAHLGSSCSFLDAGQICWAVSSRIVTCSSPP